MQLLITPLNTVPFFRLRIRIDSCIQLLKGNKFKFRLLLPAIAFKCLTSIQEGPKPVVTTYLEIDHDATIRCRNTPNMPVAI